MGMVLVNLLVGIMSTALNRVTEHEGLKLLLSKAQVIDELEATLPRWLEDRFEGQWYPKFIHVLRIDPDRVDKVDLDALWASGAQKEGGLDISVVKEGNKALEARLEAIQAQLARLEGCMGKSGLAAAENSALIASVVNNST